MRTINFGSTKIEITEQAFITFIVLIISFVAVFSASFYKGAPIVTLVVFIVGTAIIVPLTTYTVNCVNVGKCIKLSWFFTIMYIITASINVIALIILLLNNNKSVVSVRSGSPAPVIYKGSFGKNV